MSTLADVIAQTRRYLSDPVGMRNKVASHTSGQITFVNPLGAIAASSVVSAGLQTFYVWDVLQGSQTAMVDVEEGPSTLMAAGTTMRVNPRYTDYSIMQAVNDSLLSLSSPVSGLYQMKSLEIPYDRSRVGYDLPLTDVDDIYEVLAATPGPRKDWTRVHPSLIRLDRTADLTDFPSGQALNVWQVGYQGYEMRIIYRAPFGQFTALTDTTTTVGLPSTAGDLVALGAAINVMTGREIARNDTQAQGDTRRATEVPPGAVANSVNGLRMRYMQRLADEVARINRRYPTFRGD